MEAKPKDPLLELILWTALLVGMTILAIGTLNSINQKILVLRWAFGLSFPVVLGFWLRRVAQTESCLWRILACVIVVICFFLYSAIPQISAALETRFESLPPSSLAFRGI